VQIEINLPGYTGPTYTWPYSSSGGSPNGFDPVVGSRETPTIIDEQRYLTFDIQQEVTFDRQAFTGTLAIHNGSDTRDLEDLRVNIEIANENGDLLWADHRDAVDLFFTDPDLFQLTSVDGNGTLATNTDGTTEWLIIPTFEASGNTYQLSAYVEWTWAGNFGSITSEPVAIKVAPQLYVQLNYFIQPEFDAGEPFYLGVGATNIGGGSVHNLEISTHQPEVIFDKVLGSDGQWHNPGEYGVPPAQVAIDDAFLIDAAGNRHQLAGLDINFGTLNADDSSIGWWNLTAYTGGQVTDFSVAEVLHDQAIGGNQTSLLNVDTHTFWINRFGVINDGPNGSGTTSVLLDANQDGLPDSLMDLTDKTHHIGVTYVLTNVTQNPTGSQYMTATISGIGAWGYAAIDDPYGGSRAIQQIRSVDDDRMIDPRNYWLKDGQIHLLDFDRDGADAAGDIYEVIFGQIIQQTNTGKITLDYDEYVGYDAVAQVSVEDIDLDLTPGSGNDSVTITVFTLDDPSGEQIILNETGTTGLFSGSFGFEPSVIAHNDKIHAKEGQLITVAYKDKAGNDGLNLTIKDYGQWKLKGKILAIRWEDQNGQELDYGARLSVGDKVFIAVETKDMRGGDATIYLYEDDLLAPGFGDDFIAPAITISIPSDSDTGRVVWTVEWHQDTDGLTIDPEYRLWAQHSVFAVHSRKLHTISPIRWVDTEGHPVFLANAGDTVYLEVAGTGGSGPIQLEIK